MSQRGTLEVKKSSSPYFLTTSSTIGSDPLSQSLWEQKKSEKISSCKEKSSSSSTTTNFAFLYTRESDRIGNSSLTMVTDDSHKVEPSTYSPPQENNDNNNKVVADAHKVTEEFIAAYNHEPKPEHPRYTTSSNEVGRKRPTMATAVVERFGTAQEFSRSFGNVKPINSRMNTTMTRSTVHSSLDSQFI